VDAIDAAVLGALAEDFFCIFLVAHRWRTMTQN